jgi:hypothetical protein
MSLVPVPSEQPSATCANCGSPLVADQRYCLSCGQPVSPVRLAFLDVLAPGQQAAAAPGRPGWMAPGAIEVGPAGYIPVQSQGADGWLRRNSGLMGLLTVLLLCLLVGLLVGHWVGQSKTPTATSSTIKVEGLSGLGLGAAGTSTTGAATTSTSTPAVKSASEANEDKEAEEEAKHETKAEKAPPKAPVKATQQLKKIQSTTGKKHQEEVNALGDQPIETG